ncbi:HK97 family phage prohead protease [Mycobacterium sp. SMC-21]|uniref:HK97 family phage prohead protease n=1 Tax=Mycobacterium sp. SMC-21 TaxID=3381632 RepID=UPI003875C452
MITDAPEHRSIPLDRVELRSDSGDQLTLTGYASTFQEYEMYGGPAAGGWIEQIAPTAFDKTLKLNPDLMLLINHEGMPLARTKSGTLKLSVDSHGLKVSAKLDRSDPDVQRLESKMRRGDMDEMSFAFRVKAQKWSSTPKFPNDKQALRTITEVSLHKGDVSVVNYGANDTTSVELKARRGSTMGKTRTLAEIRAIEARDARRNEQLRHSAARSANTLPLIEAHQARQRLAHQPSIYAPTATVNASRRAEVVARQARDRIELGRQAIVSQLVARRAELLLKACQTPARMSPNDVRELALANQREQWRAAGLDPLTGKPYKSHDLLVNPRTGRPYNA